MSGPIRLFDFQRDAVDAMVAAIGEWRSIRLRTGVVLREGRADIPFIGAYQAIMASGKTPILASTLSRLGPAIVLWTSKSAAVIDQTYNNLSGTGKYAHLLPPGTKVLRGLPSQKEWNDLLAAEEGLVVWAMTTAAWNVSEENRDLRNLRKPQPDWADAISPWEQLKPGHHKRDLWVVYDEAHNQTDAQLDQLVDIAPYGILTGTGTTRFAPRLLRFEQVVAEDPDFGAIARTVQIETADAVEAGLLKREVRIGDANGERSSILDAVLANWQELTAKAAAEPRTVSPRALYVVEESNTRDGSAPRPVIIWSELVARGVAPDTIAMFTSTRGDLPAGCERITSVDALEPRHRHVIYNKALVEGWDDPENYIIYFDDETKDAVRISQNLGRVLRQPGASHFDLPDLNAAYVHLACPDELFDGIVSRIADELVGKYGSDAKGRPAVAVISMKSARRIEPKSEAAAWTLPVLDLVKPPFTDVEARLRTAGSTPFSPSELSAAGVERWRVIDLGPAVGPTDERRVLVAEASALARNFTVTLRDHFATRLRARNRFAANLVSTTATGPLSGPRWEQRACLGSEALAWADALAAEVAAAFEARAAYAPSANPAKRTWTPGAFLAPAGGEVFRNAAHPVYPSAMPWLNPLELEFARLLDVAGGTWSRNPSFGEGGYSIPLPARVGSSQRFFPDFVWWVDGRSFVLDTTAPHLMAEKITGKLVSITEPRIGLVAKGQFDANWAEIDPTGWTLVVRVDGEVRAEHYPDPTALFLALRALPR